MIEFDCENLIPTATLRSSSSDLRRSWFLKTVLHGFYAREDLCVPQKFYTYIIFENGKNKKNF